MPRSIDRLCQQSKPSCARPRARPLWRPRLQHPTAASRAVAPYRIRMISVPMSTLGRHDHANVSFGLSVVAGLIPAIHGRSRRPYTARFRLWQPTPIR